MQTRVVSVTDVNDGEILIAGQILRSGGLVAIPTETVYGLAANALDGRAVKSIYRAKGRPSDNPLIVHISEIEQWRPLVRQLPDKAVSLARAFWPGPLTIILKKSALVPDETSGGLDSVAVRMPEHELARAVISSAGVPLAAPSANSSGKPSPTSARHVAEDLMGKIDMIIDGGECRVGVESTVVSLAGDVPTLLRPGAVTVQMLCGVLGEVEVHPAVTQGLKSGQRADSPGMKYKHYSPSAEVVLISGSSQAFCDYVRKNGGGKALALCFEDEQQALCELSFISYGKRDDPKTQAHNLFDCLRRADEGGYETVYVHIHKTDGLGLAVYNRLIRAAGFKTLEV